jgi:hypothetical protein
MICQDKQEYGEEVARLKAAAGICTSMSSVAKATKAVLGSAAQFMEECATRYARAQKDNDSIFHEKVLAEGLLTEIEPIAAAKTLPAPPAGVVADIFARLVPMKVHLAASEYVAVVLFVGTVRARGMLEEHLYCYCSACAPATTPSRQHQCEKELTESHLQYIFQYICWLMTSQAL